MLAPSVFVTVILGVHVGRSIIAPVTDAINVVMAAQTDLVDVVHTLKQVVCAKG
ncbi:hypothetical protein WDZ92_48910 [Nostoc sp. NIES-2111]